MDLKAIGILYWREIRSALRDRTIVTNSILLPIFLYPLIIWLVYTGITFVSGQNEGLKSRIMLKDFPAAHETLKKEFERDQSILLVTSPDPADDLRNGTLDALVEFMPAQSTLPAANNFRI